MLWRIVFCKGTPRGFYYVSTPEAHLVIPGMRAVIPAIIVRRISSLGDSNSQTCRTVDDSAYLKGGLAQAKQLRSFWGMYSEGLEGHQKALD